jgi:hypothetical protein
MGAESLSYHERKAMGIGTFKERLGKDSQGNYYDCCLTLQTAVDPVVTPGGYIYSREAILENLLAQKKAIKRKMADWEGEQKEQQRKVRARVLSRPRPPCRRWRIQAAPPAPRAAQRASCEPGGLSPAASAQHTSPPSPLLQVAEKSDLEQQARLIAFDRQNHQAMSDKTALKLQRKASEDAEALHNSKGGPRRWRWGCCGAAAACGRAGSRGPPGPALQARSRQARLAHAHRARG